MQEPQNEDRTAPMQRLDPSRPDVRQVAQRNGIRSRSVGTIGTEVSVESRASGGTRRGRCAPPASRARFLLLVLLPGLVPRPAFAREISCDVQRWRVSTWPHDPARVAVRPVPGDDAPAVEVTVDGIQSGYVTTGPTLRGLDLRDCDAIEFELRVDGVESVELAVHLLEKDWTRWQGAVYAGREWTRVRWSPAHFCPLPAHPNASAEAREGRRNTPVDFSALQALSINSTLHHKTYRLYFRRWRFHVLDRDELREQIVALRTQAGTMATRRQDQTGPEAPSAATAAPTHEKSLQDLLAERERWRAIIWKRRLAALLRRGESAGD